MRKKINITLEENILKELDTMAVSLGVSRSAMVSILVGDVVRCRETYEYYRGKALTSVEAVPYQ